MWIELLAGAAWAGSCCSTTATTTPARVAECERVAVAALVEGDHAIARWDGNALPHGPSPSEDSIAATLAVGWRWSPAIQVQAALPAQFMWRSTEDLDDRGGGLGDLRFGVLLDPVEERMGPIPVLAAGVRLPTGRTWKESDGPLLADVTGTPGAAALLGASIERTLVPVPWSFGVDLEAGPQAPALLGLWGSVGKTLGTDWSISTALRAHGTFTGEGSHGTQLSLQVVRAEPVAWRAWGGLAVGVPLPGFGRWETASVTASFGAAWIR